MLQPNLAPPIPPQTAGVHLLLCKWLLIQNISTWLCPEGNMTQGKRGPNEKPPLGNHPHQANKRRQTHRRSKMPPLHQRVPLHKCQKVVTLMMTLSLTHLVRPARRMSIQKTTPLANLLSQNPQPGNIIIKIIMYLFCVKLCNFVFYVASTADYCILY